MLPQNDPQKRRKRLESMRQKLVKAAGGERLESLIVKSGSRGLESALDEGTLDVRRAAETAALDKLREGDFDTLRADQGMALEAVIEREFRQVVFINNGVFGDLPKPWTHFNSGDIRKQLDGAIASIGRVERLSITGRRTDHVGTGFIVGDRLMMTNRHVAEVFVRGAGNQPLVFKPGLPARFDFGREVGFIPTDLSGTLAIKKVKLIHPFWDMALFELESLPATAKPLQLSVLTPEELNGREMATIGYPGRSRDQSPEALRLEQQYFGGVAGVKRLAPGILEGRESTVSFGHYVPAMIHDASTQPGASGSAIFEVTNGHVVGLHFKGITLEANYSVPTHELARDQRVRDAGVNFVGNLPAPTSEWESWWQNPNQRDHTVESTSKVSIPVKPSSPALAKIKSNLMPKSSSNTAAPLSGPAADGSCTWTIPLHISISIGAPADAAPPSVAGGEESFQIPVMFDRLDQRDGYVDNFLELPGGEKVPLPELTAEGKKIAAQQANGETELKYHHFSVVMHQKRRLALFTAANLDWRKERHEVNGRKPSRSELSEIPEGVLEMWVTDDRIPDDAQLPDIFFTRDRQAFDKGHLVRRDDVAWGDDFEDIQKANGDTYYTTNCSPQVKSFNQAPQGEFNWGDLENMIQKETKWEKVILFSGPVLAANDRTFVGVSESGPVRVQIPKRFWKMIVARTDAGVKAFGFMPRQDLSRVRWEEFALPGAWEKYLVPIAEIEATLRGWVTLDWCKAHDALQG